LKPSATAAAAAAAAAAATATAAAAGMWGKAGTCASPSRVAEGVTAQLSSWLSVAGLVSAPAGSNHVNVSATSAIDVSVAMARRGAAHRYFMVGKSESSAAVTV